MPASVSSRIWRVSTAHRRHNIMHKVGPEARLSVSGTLAVSSHRQQPQHNSRRLRSSRLANPNTTQRSRYSTRLSCDHRTGPSGQQRGRGSGSELRAHPVHRAVLPLQPAYGKPLPCLALPCLALALALTTSTCLHISGICMRVYEPAFTDRALQAACRGGRRRVVPFIKKQDSARRPWTCGETKIRARSE